MLAMTLLALMIMPVAAQAVVPTDGTKYPAGTTFTLPCTSPTPVPDVHALISWLSYAAPRLPPNVYPPSYTGWDVEHPNIVEKNRWKSVDQVASNTYQALTPSPGSWTCAPDFVQSNGVSTPGDTFALWRPGYYHVLEFDVQEHHVPPPSSYPWPPDTASCADDIGGASYVSAIGPLNNGQTVVIGHCRHYQSIYFTVTADGDCTGLTPPYTDAPYVNQYDWGNKAKIVTDQYGARGGNACGASSFNMMLFNAAGSAPGTKAQTALYGATANNIVGNGLKNEFDFNAAQTMAESRGYTNARVVGLGGSQTSGVAAENLLTTFLKNGPVLTSTTFGAGDWSTAGGGHVILFLRKYAGLGAGASDGDYIVDDPAGGFFADPASHYGPGRCGHLARYPVGWAAQLTYQRWALVLGKKTGPSADAAAAGNTAVLLQVPNGVHVWVQDRGGHKVGFVASGQTIGLSGFNVNDEFQAPSDPRTPLAGNAPVQSRALIALDPGKGLTLVATGARGHKVSARMLEYRNGRLIASVNARKTLGAGVTRLLAVPSVPGGHNTPLTQLSLTATKSPGLFGPGLTVSGRAPFAGFLKITATKGSSTVGVGLKSVAAGPFSLPLFLLPGASGTVTVTATLTSGTRRVSGSISTSV